MEIVPAEEIHLSDVVKVHKAAFQGFFLTDLGDNFLKLYYRSVSQSKLSVLLVCIEKDEVVGFCAACKHSAGFNMSLVKEKLMDYLYLSVKLLFIRPKSLLRLIKNLTKKGQIEDKGNYGELLSIGVLRKMQNKGIGKQLLVNLEQLLIADGVIRLSLTTDAIENDTALSFYKKIGFRVFYEFTSYPSRRMYRLIKELR